MTEAENLRRLRWKCRRGLLELDLLFERFLNERYSNLSEEEKACFERLLEESDTELQAWLLGQATPQDAAWFNVIQKIR